MKKKVLSLLLVFALCLSACGGEVEKESTQPQVTPVETASEPTSTPTPEPTPSPDAEPLAIGDSATIDNWSVVVSDFYFADKIADGEFFQYSPDEGNLYAVVSAQVTNNGKESDTFLPAFATNSDVKADIYYAGEYEYSASLLMMDDDLHDSTEPVDFKKRNHCLFGAGNDRKQRRDPVGYIFSRKGRSYVFPAVMQKEAKTGQGSQPLPGGINHVAEGVRRQSQ